MNRIIFLFIAIFAITFTSCSDYQAKRDIKKYEESNGKTVYSISVKQVETTCIYVAKIRYKLDQDRITVPVFHVYKWDKYGYLNEMEDCDLKFETVEYYFPEAIDIDDYVIVKAYYQWKRGWENGDKTKEIDYYINIIRNGRE